MRIASYNIRKARGLDNKRRPDRILQVVNGLDADVVVLQEADKRLGPRPTALPRKLIETETDFTLVEVNTTGDLDGSIGWHGNAVLLRKGTVEQAVERLDLPGFEPRGALRVTLDTGLVVVATHLGLMRQSRQAQLSAIGAATALDPYVVIAGDFNEWSGHKGLEPLAARFTTHSPGRSFHARRPLAGLDRLALSEGIEMRDAGVQQGQMAKVASDHLPVWADVMVPATAI